MRVCLLHSDENMGSFCTFFKGVKNNLHSIHQCSTLIYVRLRKMSHLVRDIMNEQLCNKACILWEMSYMGHVKKCFVHITRSHICNVVIFIHWSKAAQPHISGNQHPCLVLLKYKFL